MQSGDDPLVLVQITHKIILPNTSSTRTKRGGSCLTIRPFSSIELACAVRQPGPCMRALCEAVAVLLSKNMTCAITLQRNAKRTFSSDFTLRSSHLALHTSHFALHTPHFISSQFMRTLVTSSQLFSSHPISSHMSSK